MSEGIIFAKGDAKQREKARAFLLRVLDNQLSLDRAWEVTIKRYRRERTDLQNKALFGLAYKILHEETGNDVDDLHTFFLGEHFGWVEYDVLGSKRRRPARTTTTDEHGKRSRLSTVEFAAFFEFIQRRAMEAAGVFIPDPDPDWKLRA